MTRLQARALSLVAALIGCGPGFQPEIPAPAGVPVAALPARLTDVATAEHLVVPPSDPGPSAAVLRDDFSQGLDGWEVSLTSSGDLGEAVADGGQGCLRATSRTGSDPIPTLSRRVSVSGGELLQVSVLVETDGLRPRASRGAGAGLVVTQLDGDGEELRVHDDLPRQYGTTDGMVEVSGTLRVDDEARVLQIVLEAANGRAAGGACFDDLTVTRLSAIEAASRLQSAHGGAHPLVRIATLGDDSRPSALAPGGVTWAMGVPGGEPVTLRFAAGIVPGAEEDARVCMAVQDALARQTLWSRCLDGDHEGWADVRIDLPDGGPRELHFVAHAEEGEAIAAWGDPRVVSRNKYKRNNIVLVIIDTLRADHLGVEGYETRWSSPQLDLFAAGSVRFAEATATSGWTSASLGSVVTGLLPAEHRAGIRRVRAWEPDSLAASSDERKRSNYLRMSAGVETLSERLRAAGYETAGFSTNNFFGPRIGFDRGFSRYQMLRGNNVTGATSVVDEVQAWLSSREAEGAEDPFFLTVHVIDPHHPYRLRLPAPEGFEVPVDFEMESERQGFKRALVLREHSAASRAHADQVQVLYDAEIRHVDGALGGLLSQLDDGHTAIVLLSDHGEGFGEHGKFIHGNSQYQELLHVPLWVRAPGVEPRTVEDPVSLLDVTPTVLGLAGIDIPPALHGTPLPLDGGPVTPRVMLSEGMYTGPFTIAAREGGWKYIWELPTAIANTTSSAPAVGRRPTEELFYLPDDPGEQHNRLRDQPEIAARLAAAVRTHVDQMTRGVHVRCASESLIQVLVEVQGVVGEIEVLGASKDTTLALYRDRQSVRLVASSAAVILRPVGAVTGASLIATVDGVSERWEGALPVLDAPAHAGPCTVWGVGGVDEVGELSEDDAIELQAMGYLE